ncbi:hypothetical protein D2V17_07675 [Aurantiacibacter xanthus]|uniref:Ubiquinol-cytochrome c chaperone domain-containing protein n=1 Tax=Aurantiacibacter xanthus TaxID=1784712 RepID=A0A3A1P4Z3_9SPHN|nr:ubiquinol-cytochrome C chaperone family protein [Aurantiacibacter xanthus]RIV88349.1 hypothetical protein D2V17_07675 [Aurantiacibacter xanthus]
MSLISRLLRPAADPREALPPLWHDVVIVSRERDWYAHCGVADTVDGRFDMIVLVLSLVLLRMEKNPALTPQTALLTELFVADMDRQLRETGVGDLMVGKRMGKIMSALGGRMGALREAMIESDAKLAEILARNVALVDEDKKPFHLAVRARALHADLAAQSEDALLAGKVRP